MVNFFLVTGPFLLPLLLLSLYSVALIFEKSHQLKSEKALASEVFDRFLQFIEAGNLSGAAFLLPAKNVSLQKLLGKFTQVKDRQREERELLLQSYAQILVSQLEDRLSYFPALANLSTLLGLFGTVCGMIISFLALRSGGGADPSALSTGIAQALVATAFGLITAIPSLAAHALFQKKIQSTVIQMESLGQVLSILEERNDAAPQL